MALNKPIIIIKPGRSAAAAQAAASHTGSLTGSDEVLEAAFRRSGVLRVNNIADLFYMAEVLSKQPTPKGPRLTIVTNAGGPGVLATDSLIMGGGELAETDAGDHGAAYNAVLPATWSHSNPVDIIGDALARALRQGARDRRQGSESRRHAGDSHAAGDDRSDAHCRAAEAAAPVRKASRCWRVGWAAVDVGGRRRDPQPRQHSHLPYPDTAARAFNYMWQYADNLKGHLRNAGAAGGFRRPGRRTASWSKKIIAGSRGRPHHPHRVRDQSRCWRPTAFPRSPDASSPRRRPEP